MEFITEYVSMLPISKEYIEPVAFIVHCLVVGFGSAIFVSLIK